MSQKLVIINFFIHVLLTLMSLYGVKVYSWELQTISETNPCRLNNGGCEKICFVISSNNSVGILQARCSCPYGERLADDQTSCKANPSIKLPVQSYHHSCAFICDNGRCVPKTWLCDGEDDCRDNSDEERGCNITVPTCGSNEFQCKSGRCIPFDSLCDQENGCRDSSNEFACRNVTCSASHFTCANGRCISNMWKCDSENDCGDGSDEGDFCAKGTCLANQFKCADLRHCVEASYKCDGLPDCNDGSDELGCPSMSANQCNREKHFRCKSSGLCIPIAWHCDGSKGCSDHSDEEDCGQITCAPNFFKCDNSNCVFKEYICDGKDDCGDGSDESAQHSCVPPPFKCPDGQWQCPNDTDRCVNITSVCNNTPDCPNGADEGEGCDLSDCEHQTSFCSNGCQKTPFGATCICPPGFEIGKDDYTCVDINECDPPGLCSQQCTNTKGSYFCSCTDDYILEPNKHKCKAVNHTVAILIISSRHSIIVTDLKEHGLQRDPITAENVVATASNMHTGTIFWSDKKLKKILRLDRGMEPQEIIVTGLDLVESLVYDWVAKNLYWIDSSLNTIEVSSENGINRLVLVHENLKQPRGICIDPSPDARLIFWTDWGENPRIESIGMDGTMRKTIISAKIYLPTGLTLDISTKRVYFADSKLNFIDFCYYNGTGRHQVLAGSHYVLHPHSLSMFEDTLYWTDRHFVLSTNKFRGKNQTVVSRLISQPLSMHVHHPSLQPIYPNPCASANCQYLCLLSPSSLDGYACKCKLGYLLLSEGRCVVEGNSIIIVDNGTQIVDLPLNGGDNRTGSLAPAKQKPCDLHTQYQCANKECVERSQVCDYSDDCGDASDELGCHHTSTCTEATRGGCEHHCYNLTEGDYICACYPGYIISPENKKQCTDVDECATREHTCSHNCHNLNGTYSCSCRDGFRLVEGMSGNCKAEKDNVVLVFSNGPEIRALDLQKKEEFSVINSGNRIEALDYDATQQIIFWADSYDMTIKRSYMVNAVDGQAKVGFAQDLNMKGGSKPTAVGVDWLAGNLYWTEVDRTGSKPRGRVMVAKTDGRYRHSIATAGLELPTSIAVNPQLGHIFWADAGSAPKIEVSWMDGSKRRPLITEAVNHPAGLALDYSQDNVIYWVDSKLNTIESMRSDGSRRKVIAMGQQLHHPVSLDIFESTMYWVTRDTGELLRQDKFGRGVQVVVHSNLVNSSRIKVYHEKRYSTSMCNPCSGSSCSHLRLLVPGGHRCACPDSSGPLSSYRNRIKMICDAATERPRQSPLICPCENGGFCKKNDREDLLCDCQPDFNGDHCEHSIAGAFGDGGANVAAVVVFIMVILLVMLAAGSSWYIIRKNPFVTFGNGTNVEFNSPGFAGGPPPLATSSDIAPSNRGLQLPA